MKKILFIGFLLFVQHGFAQQQPTDVQIRYALNLFGQNLKKHNIKSISDVLDETFHVAEYRDRDLTNVLPQLINPVVLDTVYFEPIVKKNDKIYAKMVAVPKTGPKMQSWLRLNNFLAFERIGHFEQLMGLQDPVFQELQPAKLLAKTAISRSSGLMFVEVSITGSDKKYNFLFDSGAGATTLSEGLATSLNLKVNQKAIDIKTAGNAGQFKTIDTLGLNIAGVKVRGKQVVIANLSSLQAAVGHQLDGIIGFDLLKDYQVAVNLDEREMSIYNFGYFEHIGKNILPIQLTNNIPKVNIKLKVDGVEYPTRLTFDTGAGGSIYGNYFLNAYTDGLVDKLKYKSTSASMDLNSQISKSEIGLIDEIEIAGMPLSNPSIALDLPAEQPAYGFTQHGLLGMSLIGRFNLLFNYNLNYIELKPNKTFSTPLVPLYILGLGFKQEGNKFILKHVDEKGTAFQAGLRTGDELYFINKIKPTSVDQITQELRGLAKNAIVIEVIRKQKTMKFDLKKLPI